MFYFDQGLRAYDQVLKKWGQMVGAFVQGVNVCGLLFEGLMSWGLLTYNQLEH